MFKKLNIESLASRATALLATVAISASLISCSDDDEPIAAGDTHNWEISGNELVNIKPERQKFLRNPLTGWVTYTGLGDGLADTFWEDYDHLHSSVGEVKISDYSAVLFIRAAWTYFNPEEGKYVWNEGEVDNVYARRFKFLVDGAKERNMKLAFSFICDSQDKHDNFTPDFVREAGAKGYMSTTGSVQVWSPFPDDPVFQEKYEEFIAAFAKKFDDPDVCMFVSGTGLGKWGESHSAIYSTANEEPRESVVEWVTSMYARHITRVPIFINYHRALMTTTSFPSTPSELTTKLIESAINKGFSLRHDAFGMKAYYKDWERNWATAYRNKRPIIMEGGWVRTSHGSSINGDGYATYADVRRGEYNEGKNANVCMMDFRYNKSIALGETYSWFNDAYDLIQEFIAEGSYRLYPDKISIPSSAHSGATVTFTHRWSNLGWGYCPTNIPQWNQKYKVAFALLDGAGLPVHVYVDPEPCLDTWVKGSPSTYTSKINLGNVANGNYTWAVGLVDTTKDNAIGLQISAKGDFTADGWLKLGSVSIK